MFNESKPLIPAPIVLPKYDIRYEDFFAEDNPLPEGHFIPESVDLDKVLRRAEPEEEKKAEPVYKWKHKAPNGLGFMYSDNE